MQASALVAARDLIDARNFLAGMGPETLGAKRFHRELTSKISPLPAAPRHHEEKQGNQERGVDMKSSFEDAGGRSVRALMTGDPRSDDSARRIAVDGEQVCIRRRYKGIDMRVAVPVAAYRGVILLRANGPGGLHEVRLLHNDPDLSILLVRDAREDRAIAAWQSWATFLGLAALVEPSSMPGSRERIERPTSKSAARVLTACVDRRPRFLARRKIGCADRLGTVHRNEREIIAYE